MRALGLFVVGALTITCSREAPSPSAPTVSKRVTFSILEDYDKGEDLANVARDFDLFAELGITTWRGSFGWDDYEPTRGTYDFGWLHRFATLAADRGITLRPYIGYTPAWAAAGGHDGDVWNDPPKDLDAWSQFVRTLAAEMRRHTNIVSYEIYNEENVRQWWDGTPAAYRDVLGRAADAIRAGNPGVQVLLGGMVFADREWVEAVCDDGGSGRKVDVIPFHAYPETWTPAGVTVETYLSTSFEADFAQAADTACGRKPLWINETGYATTPGRTEADQAYWWMRAVATFAATPRIEHIGIYEIKDARQDRPVIGDAPNYHLGLADVNRRRKLAFGTVKRLVAMLGSHSIAASAPRVSVTGAASPQVFSHLFSRDDGRQILFLWTRSGDVVVDVEVDRAASQATEYGIDGNETGRVGISGGRLQRIALKPGLVRLFEISTTRRRGASAAPVARPQARASLPSLPPRSAASSRCRSGERRAAAWAHHSHRASPAGSRCAQAS
jgi:polysaccharide biosynthesis protein PslG